MGVTFDKLLGKLLMHTHKASDIAPAVSPVSGVIANGLVASIPAGVMLEKIVVIKRGTITNPAPPPATIADAIWHCCIRKSNNSIRVLQCSEF